MREGPNDARDLCYTSGIAFIIKLGSAAIQFVDFNGTVRMKVDSVRRCAELVSILSVSTFQLMALPTAVLRERL